MHSITINGEIRTANLPSYVLENDLKELEQLFTFQLCDNQVIIIQDNLPVPVSQVEADLDSLFGSMGSRNKKQAIVAILNASWERPKTIEEKIKEALSLPIAEQVNRISLIAAEEGLKDSQIRPIVTALKKTITLEDKKVEKEETVIQARAERDVKMSQFIRLENDAFDGDVDAKDLFDSILAEAPRFLYLSSEQEIAATIWPILSWFIGPAKMNFAPLAWITAAEASCGKSTLLKFLARFSYRACHVSDVSQAVIPLIIDEYGPTLMIDEADANVAGNETLRKLIDAGFEREGSVKLLNIQGSKDAWSPECLNCFGPKVVCGIGGLERSITSRSVVFKMRPFEEGIKKEKISINFEVRGSGVALYRAKINRLSIQYLPKLLSIMEEFKLGIRTLPDELRERNGDVWLGLYQVALLAGEEWGEKLINAALVIERSNVKGVGASSEKVRLLRAIWSVFQKEEYKTEQFLSTHTIISEITGFSEDLECSADNDSPWYSFRQTGQTIKAKDIADILRKFNEPNTDSVQVRIKDKRDRGYMREAIEGLYSLYGKRS